MQCGSGAGDMLTLGCIATGFTPASLTFKWKDTAERALNDFVQYPVVQTGGKYIGVSQLRVKRAEWDNKKTFKCAVEHSAGSKEVIMQKPVQRVSPPNINLYPLWEGVEEGSKVGLLCILSGFYPDTLSVEWLLDGKAVTTSPVQLKLQSVEGEEKTFSLSSRLELDRSQWNQASKVTCKATHNAAPPVSRTTSICSAFPSSTSTPSIHLETPRFRTVMTQTDVIATCVVHSAYDAKVTWLLDGKVPTSKTLVNQHSSTTQSISSNLTLPSSQWKTLNTITCRAEHRCFNPTHKTSNVKGPAVITPTVLIRSLPDLQNGNSAVLECAITQLSSSDLYVTFQANGVDFPEKQYVDLPASKETHSLTRRFSVPTSHAKTDNTFTCKVNQGFHNSWVSKSTGHIFVERPPISFYVMTPSKEEMQDNQTASFACLARDFSPKHHEITWLKNNKPIAKGVKNFCQDEKKGEDNTMYSATSFLSVGETEWTDGSEYTCQFSHKSGNQTKTVKYSSGVACDTDVEFQFIEPTPENLFLGEKIPLVCRVTSKQSGFMSIKWMTENKTIIYENTIVEDKTITAKILISYEEWRNGTTFICSVEHKELLSPEEKSFRRENGEMEKRPSVFLLAPTEITSSDMVTLTCYVKDFYPKTVLVAWLVNDELVTVNSTKYQYNTTSAIETGRTFYSVYGQLTMGMGDWIVAGEVYSCVVYHETIPKSTKMLVRTLDRTSNKPNLVNLSLNVPQSCKAQ